jgi:hypothetical protein
MVHLLVSHLEMLPAMLSIEGLVVAAVTAVVSALSIVAVATFVSTVVPAVVANTIATIAIVICCRCFPCGICCDCHLCWQAYLLVVIMGKETDECVIHNSWVIRLDSHLTVPECLVVVRLHLEEGSMYPHICENGFCSLQEASNTVEFSHVLPEGQRVHGWMVFGLYAIGVVVDLCKVQACSIGRLLLD